VAKGLSYRIVGTTFTGACSFVVTGSLRAAFIIGAVEVTTKLLLFWGHERLWNRIRWGRHRGPVARPTVRPVAQVSELRSATSNAESAAVPIGIEARRQG
jgi:uncharacterized membrane protein